MDVTLHPGNGASHINVNNLYADGWMKKLVLKCPKMAVCLVISLSLNHLQFVGSLGNIAVSNCEQLKQAN